MPKEVDGYKALQLLQQITQLIRQSWLYLVPGTSYITLVSVSRNAHLVHQDNEKRKFKVVCLVIGVRFIKDLQLLVNLWAFTFTLPCC